MFLISLYRERTKSEVGSLFEGTFNSILEVSSLSRFLARIAIIWHRITVSGSIALKVVFLPSSETLLVPGSFPHQSRSARLAVRLVRLLGKTCFLPFPFILPSWGRREGNVGGGNRFVSVINVRKKINLALT